jgi:hypothetical protein
MIPEYLVIDTIDGYTIWRDYDGVFLTEDTASRMADLYNSERKPEVKRWIVAKVVPVQKEG